MDLCIVTYTHTDYKDIWPLTWDGAEKLESIPCEKYVACNTAADVPQMYNGVLIYDDSFPYPHRVAQILEQIDSEYVLFIHDIDVIIHWDLQKFVDLFRIIQKHQLDRLFLGMLNRIEPCIEESEFSLTPARSSPIYVTPYDVGPSVWKRSSFLALMKKYQTKSYREIEFCEIQKDCLELKCYGIALTKFYDPMFQLARPVCSHFQYVHILASGRWFHMLCYMDFQLALWKLIQKYNIDLNHRGIAPELHLFQVSRSLG